MMSGRWGNFVYFVALTVLVQPPATPGVAVFGDIRRVRGPLDEVIESAQVVEQILDRVLRGWRESVPLDPHNRWQQERQAAQRAIVQLERAAEIREKLGDDAPQLDAAQMHPWVWEGRGRCGRAATTARPPVLLPSR